MKAADQIISYADAPILGQLVDGLFVIPLDILSIDDLTHVLIGKAGRRIVSTFFTRQHAGQRFVGILRLQPVQGDRFVGDRILLLLPLPFFAGQAAHIIIETTGCAVIILHHRKVFETLAKQHTVPVHGKMIREGGAPGKMTGDVGTRGDRGDARVFPKVLAEQVVGRTVGIGEGRRALSVVETVP